MNVSGGGPVSFAVRPYKRPRQNAVHGLPRRTPALRLRHFLPDDAAPILALNAEPSTSRWLPSHLYPTLEDASSALVSLISCYSAPGRPQDGPYVLAVEHRGNGRLLGHVGFSPLGNEVEVSFAIAESFRGHGFGTEALTHACSWVTEAFRLSQVLALTAPENIASRRLLQRAHFAHMDEVVMVFQGRKQVVSRYIWHAPGSCGEA